MNISPANTSESSLKEVIDNAIMWITFLVKKWKVISFFALSGALFGLTFSFFEKPVYTATLTFALEEEKSKGGDLSGALGLAGSFGLDLNAGGGGIFNGLNLTELFKSRLMVEQTLLSPIKIDGKIVSLAEMYIKINNWREDWNEKPTVKNLQFLPNANRDFYTRTQDSIIGLIFKDIDKNSLKVAQKKEKISIISVDFLSRNEKFAKLFTETLTKNVSDFYIKTKIQKAASNLYILEKQADSVQRVLSSGISGVASANDNIFGLNPALNIKRANSTRKQVDVQTNIAILSELVKQCELAKVTLRKDTPLVQVIDRPIYPLPNSSVGLLKATLIGFFTMGFLSIVLLLMKRIINQIYR